MKPIKTKVKDSFSIIPVTVNGKTLYELREKQASYGKFISPEFAMYRKMKLLRDREELAVIVATEDFEIVIE
jgi:hypothetical protein